ncbi:hypothetical protein DPMN_039164 [Dreissena polymorpha]|uniref:Uncharacterized protein n=1 Tax=Dreissena polymorpha TaxID=45954 RepID=A0A9D4RRF5_DREPO|nr:hypothetical protein DPMN_039164 [Dreissena polymorpha]
MLRHSMSIIGSVVQYLNPVQVPVIAFDQPLYAIAKQIQWGYPDIYGESKLVTMLGGLHIEMAVLKTIGDWLQDSGWTHALLQADIASAGTADSFLKPSHVSRSRHAHQVTACALYILMYRAHQS